MIHCRFRGAKPWAGVFLSNVSSHWRNPGGVGWNGFALLRRGFSLFLNRREFHRFGLLTAAGLAVPRAGLAGRFFPGGQATELPKPVTLAAYVDPLPIPPVLSAAKTPGAPVTIRMAPFRQKVHRDLPPTTLWGYNGSWPGPTIEVHRDQPFSVQWVNALPTKHFLPLDFTIHGAEETVPPVRA